MKFYVATAFAAKDLHRTFTRMMQAAGPHYLTYDWTKNERASDQEDRARAEQIAAEEIAAVLAADVLVVLLPGPEHKTSGRGTHVELGMAIAHKAERDYVDGPDSKRVVVWSWDGSHFEGDTCLFYFAPGVERVVGPLAELVDYLS